MTVVGSSVTPLVYRAALAGLLVAAVCSFLILVRYPAAPFVFPVTCVEIPVIFQVMTDVVGNPEEERRADFFHLPWSQEAVCRYFYGKVMITQKLLICSCQMIISSAL